MLGNVRRYAHQDSYVSQLHVTDEHHSVGVCHGATPSHMKLTSLPQSHAWLCAHTIPLTFPYKQDVLLHVQFVADCDAHLGIRCAMALLLLNIQSIQTEQSCIQL